MLVGYRNRIGRKDRLATLHEIIAIVKHYNSAWWNRPLAHLLSGIRWALAHLSSGIRWALCLAEPRLVVQPPVHNAAARLPIHISIQVCMHMAVYTSMHKAMPPDFSHGFSLDDTHMSKHRTTQIVRPPCIAQQLHY